MPVSVCVVSSCFREGQGFCCSHASLGAGVFFFLGLGARGRGCGRLLSVRQVYRFAGFTQGAQRGLSGLSSGR